MKVLQDASMRKNGDNWRVSDFTNGLNGGLGRSWRSSFGPSEPTEPPPFDLDGCSSSRCLSDPACLVCCATEPDTSICHPPAPPTPTVFGIGNWVSNKQCEFTGGLGRFKSDRARAAPAVTLASCASCVWGCTLVDPFSGEKVLSQECFNKKCGMC